MLHAIAIASANPSATGSTRACSSRGTPGGLAATTPVMNHCASTRPAAAAVSASTVLSVSSWRTMRPRPAPSAVRTAISRPRAAPRASSRFATLPHAIRSTSPTAPSRMNRRDR